MKTIGLIHPGAMGAAVAVALKTSKEKVIWASEGRSEESKTRALHAGLEDVVDLESLVQKSDLIFSVCPPALALELATKVASFGFKGLYVDANAIAPETSSEVSRLIRNIGAGFVDGSVVGGPPKEKGETRIYFSGEQVEEICSLFNASLFEAINLGSNETAASALKMAYAAWTKGSSALLLNVRALAKGAGVEEALLKEWHLSLPELELRSHRTAFTASQKAWRFIGEMQEISKTFKDLGLPDGFHKAATEVYEGLASFKGRNDHSTQEVLEKLLETNTKPS